MKKKLAIIAGGKSPEHEVSLISAYNIMQAADANIFEVHMIGISKTGNWYYIPADLYAKEIKIGTMSEHIPLLIDPNNTPVFCSKNNDFSFHPDVVFPIAHGIFGEDGNLQGLLNMINLPFVGPNTLASAMGMDKDITKKLATLAGVKVTPSMTLYKYQQIDLDSIVQELGLPLFVKPVNMGSAVGVEKATDLIELKNAIANAFIYDKKILVEKAITGREVETAVLGNENPKVSRVGEIVIENDFYTYENKYKNDVAKIVIPAENLSEKSIALMQDMAIKTYKALELSGLTRVDFFYVSDDEIYLNEVNTLPGFTNISMYPKLWEERGLSFTDLITALVGYAER